MAQSTGAVGSNLAVALHWPASRKWHTMLHWRASRQGHAGGSAPSGVTPLPAVLALVFTCSMGTGVLNSGVFFLANSRYGFDAAANFALAVMFAAFYIPSAAFIGPILRRVIERLPWLTTRAVLATIVLCISLLAVLPIAADQFPVWSPWPSWPIWVTVAGYAILTGNLWPLVESYTSGGRKGERLRTAIGRFNITWAAALVIVFWAMAPLVEPRPLDVIASVGAVHLLSLILLLWFPRDPAGHVTEHHEPHPPVYTRLLLVAQVLLPMSYLMIGAVQPLMPKLCEHAGAPAAWQTPLASLWLIARLVTFAMMERWHGWHGRWWTPGVGACLLIVGAGAAVASASLPAGTTGAMGLGAGLVLLGIGAGMIYAVALYYAMEVGQSQVDAGGRHEALIGAGYLVGPAIGLTLTQLVAVGRLTPESFELTLLSLVVVIALGVTIIGFGRALGRRPN